jgi:hypothetical protein
MYEILRGYAARTCIMILAMGLAVFLLAGIRTVLEFISPTYSGFGPWRPMVEGLTVILVFACILLVLEAVATLIPRFRFISKICLTMAGFICALGAAEPLITRIFHSNFNFNSLELLVIIAAVIGAASIRFIGGRASA